MPISRHGLFICFYGLLLPKVNLLVINKFYTVYIKEFFEPQLEHVAVDNWRSMPTL